MESQGGVMASGQDHIEQPWPPREQKFQLAPRIRRDQLVQIGVPVVTEKYPTLGSRRGPRVGAQGRR